MLLEVRDLDVSYGSALALKGVSIDVRLGERVAIVGPNGAGKSTLLKAISGILPPAAGQIIFGGNLINGRTPRQLIEQSIVYVPQGRRVFPSLTVRENIEVMLDGISKNERRARIDDVYTLFPFLHERGQARAGVLSGGEQQVVALARAMAVRPQLLLLDEPSHGLSPRWVEQIFDFIQRLRGVGMLIVEQNVRKVLSVTHRGYVLKFGRVVREGAAEELGGNMKSDWGLAIAETAKL